MNRRFAFAQARLQSRYGNRAGPALWQQLEQTREFGLLLQQARGHAAWATALAGIDADSDPHRVEHAIREGFREQVAELSCWLPAEWLEAARWIAHGPELSLVRYLLDGGSPAPWMSENAAVAELAAAAPADRFRLASQGPFASLAEPDAGGLDATELWRRRWRQTFPSMPRKRLDAMERVARGFAALFAADGGGRADGERAAFVRLIRRHAGEAPAIFAFLGLALDDLYRLRGILLRRLLLPALEI